MSYSLNEIEALSKRAARGAGLEWGVAEEAAKATRWLCHYGLDGSAALAEILTHHHERPNHLQAPSALTGVWRAKSGALCPLLAGACLSDCAAHIAENGVLLGPVHTPMLLLPFVAAAARTTGQSLSVSWDGASVVTDGRALAIPHLEALPAQQVAHVTIVPSPLQTPTHRAGFRAAPSAQTLETLNLLAALTYAPATESSRQLGAGSELSDND